MRNLKVVVGSKNPVKINAAKVTLAKCFPEFHIEVAGIPAPSGVSDQPMTEEETLLGAKNRVAHLESIEAADFYVAFEGGVDTFSYGVSTFAYVVVSDGQNSSVGRTADLPLPKQFYGALESGQELGDVLDQHFQTTNIKQKGGAIGLLTRNLETRESTYVQAMTLAMARHLERELFVD